jgi:hypothetical protein
MTTYIQLFEEDYSTAAKNNQQTLADFRLVLVGKDQGRDLRFAKEIVRVKPMST